MSAGAHVSWALRARRTWDALSVYLPIALLGLMAMTSYWLVRNTPESREPELEAAPRHVPDYFMRDFSVRVFGADGKLKSEMLGVEGRHFPDTDTLEIDKPRIRILGADGRVTTATAQRGLINSDGSEVQLFERAVVVREASTNAKGLVTPRSEMQSDFLHLFANTEQVRSHLPVVLLRGRGDRFTADAMNYDNLDRVLQLKGRVRGTLQPPKAKN
jgi:lipopolysaccharide export system protein LptC